MGDLGLCDCRAWQLAEMLRLKEVSAREVMAAFLDRISQVNPLLNAIVTIDEEGARHAAATADKVLAAGRVSGPLHGLPIAIKDTHETRGMRTTFGSVLFADYVPSRDAPHVKRLRRAGAIVIGKTNTPEFAAGSQTFNRVFGTTRNPYALDRTPGGSSGGAAAAVASRMLPFAEGSDLAASIRNPASFCNLVGLRPSQWRLPPTVPQDAFLPLSVVGPLARSCRDARLLLQAMSPQPRRLATGSVPLRPRRRPVRIAWCADADGLPVDPEVRDVLSAAVTALGSNGWQVREAAPYLAAADEVFRVMRALYLAARFGDLLRDHRSQIKQTLAANIELGQRLTGDEVANAYRQRGMVFSRMQDLLSSHDVLALPTVQVAPFPADQEWVASIAGVPQATYIDWLRSCSRVTVTAHPAVSIPAGFTADGLPVGLQLIGRLGSDYRLLDIAKEIEEVLGATSRIPDLRRSSGTPADLPGTASLRKAPP
jgi:amidase